MIAEFFLGSNIVFATINSPPSYPSLRKNKIDTSGTMKKMLGNLGSLLKEDLTIDDISKVRDPIVQRDLINVPEEWVDWHAYHVFNISNVHDGAYDAEELTFKRHGGESYRLGTMSALDFLTEGKNTKYFNTMIDVLKAE